MFCWCECWGTSGGGRQREGEGRVRAMAMASLSVCSRAASGTYAANSPRILYCLSGFFSGDVNCGLRVMICGSFGECGISLRCMPFFQSF